MNIQVGIIKDSSGNNVGGQEYVRQAFDQALWDKMGPGDKMVLPRTAELSENLGSHMSASFGNNQILTKMSDTVTGSVTGLVIDSL